jgi:hypothetical protein
MPPRPGTTVAKSANKVTNLKFKESRKSVHSPKSLKFKQNSVSRAGTNEDLNLS